MISDPEEPRNHFFYSISVNTQNTFSLEVGERKFTFLSCSNTIIHDTTCIALMIAIRYIHNGRNICKRSSGWSSGSSSGNSRSSSGSYQYLSDNIVCLYFRVC